MSSPCKPLTPIIALSIHTTALHIHAIALNIHTIALKIQSPTSCSFVCLFVSGWATQELGGSMEISASEMAKGFARMSEAVDDLSLDVPGCHQKYTALKTKAQAEKLVA
eukprot:6804357-Pyramimonas_sp.AAC.1